AEDGPTAYGCSLPIPELMRTLALAGAPVSFSDNAGGFVCNHLFYTARHHIETQGLYLPMAFIHTPPLPEQVADRPSRRGLPLDRLETAARAVVAWLRRGLNVTA
ncbi:pyrrolidone-carboxylate peptidase, partial [bacterium]|nr:pyrrolidone-carboxylate peptidase [bacterium]